MFRRELLLPGLYLLFVVVCIFFAFDFDGRTNDTAWLILMAATLPWSVISMVFAWAIMHGAGLELFAVMYFLFAVVNALLINRIARPKNPDLR